jgi:hypothetical protein
MAVTDLATGIPDTDDNTAVSPPAPPTTRAEPPTGRGGSQLTRTTVNLTSRTVAALERMSGEGHGPTKTELINRGVQLLEIFEKVLDRNDGSITIRHNDGTEEKIWVLRG